MEAVVFVNDKAYLLRDGEVVGEGKAPKTTLQKLKNFIEAVEQIKADMIKIGEEPPELIGLSHSRVEGWEITNYIIILPEGGEELKQKIIEVLERRDLEGEALLKEIGRITREKS